VQISKHTRFEFGEFAIAHAVLRDIDRVFMAEDFEPVPDYENLDSGMPGASSRASFPGQRVTRAAWSSAALASPLAQRSEDRLNRPVRDGCLEGEAQASVGAVDVGPRDRIRISATRT
jgi:hypothetical protein